MENGVLPLDFSWHGMSGLWLCLALFVALINANLDVFMVKVEPRAEDCFYEDVNVGDTVTYEYHVVDGGLLDVEIRVRGGFLHGSSNFSKLFRHTTRYYTKLYFEGRDESTYSFTADTAGTYALCFNNEMSRWTVKTITFSVRVQSAESKNAPKADMTPFEDILSRMEEDFGTIEKEQAHYRVREHTHRSGTQTFKLNWLIFSCWDNKQQSLHVVFGWINSFGNYVLGPGLLLEELIQP